MRFVETAEFMIWATAQGMGRSVEYPHSKDLLFLSESATWYRYRPGREPSTAAQLADMAVRVAAAGQAVWVVPPPWDGATWSINRPPDLPKPPEITWLEHTLRDLGIARDFAGAIQFDPPEVPKAARLLATTVPASFWFTLSIIPEHARCILSSDEDDDVIGWFPDDSACASYTQALIRAGWVEPTEPDPRVSATDPWLDL